MKLFFLVVLSIFIMSFSSWGTSITEAKAQALKEHKCILLTFSGSDWCGPCIRLHKEFFNDVVFTSFADSNLILINADFPRQKKNQLNKTLQKENEHLADEYNSNGAFPYTVLLNAEGKVLKAWDGLPKEKPENFVDEIKAHTNATN